MATYRINLDLLEETKNTYANAEEIINTDIEIAKTVVNSVGNDIYLGEDADTFQNDFTGYINEDMTDALGNVRAIKTILENGLDDGRTCKKLCHDFLNVLGGSSEKSKEEMVGMLFCEQAVIASMQVACKEAVTYAENIRIGANAIDNILDELRMVSMDSTTYTDSIRNGCDKVDKLENFSSALTTYASAVESMDDYLKIGLDNCSPSILPTASQSKGTEITPAPAIIEIEMPVLASDENRQTDAEILQKQKEIKQLEQKIAVETDGILQNGYYSELLRKQEQLKELEKIKNQTLLPTNPTAEEVAWALSTWAAPGYIMTEAEKKQARKLFGNGMYPGIDRESITEEDAINLAYAYSKSNPIQNFMLGVSDNALFHLLSDTFEKYGDMPQLEYETPSMEQMTDNAYIQQPVVTTAGKLTGSVAEFAIFSKLIQLIPGVGAAAEKGGQLVGNTITSLMNKLKIKGAEEAGKLVTTKATEILSDTTVDIALDTVPNLTENIKNGLPVEETLRNAAQSIGTNLGYNLAGTVILHGLNKAVSGSGVKGGKYSAFGKMSFKDGKQYSAWNKLREEGLTFEQAEKIKHIEKGQKPAPETYLSNEYIQNHLQSFKDSGAVKIMPNEPSGTIGGKGGTFVMSGDELDEIIQYANGDISKIEDALGLDPGYLGKNPVIVMMDDSSNVRMPSGNELGAWPEYWEPGGYTSGGIKEAVIDPVPEGEYTCKFLFE